MPSCTFHELGALYLRWGETHHQGLATGRSPVPRFHATFGPSQLRDITPLTVDDYLSTRATERKPVSVNKEAQLLHHMFKQAIAAGKALANPVKHVHSLRVNNRRLRFLSQDKIGRLLAVADGYLHSLLITALHTGLAAACPIFAGTSMEPCEIRRSSAVSGMTCGIPSSRSWSWPAST